MVEIAKLLASATKGNTVPAEHTDMMWSTLITGIVVVFMILVLLVLILWLLGKVLNVKTKKPEPEKPTAQPQTAAAEAVPAEESVEYDEEDDSEIIAVIAAAIAAYGEANGKQYRIASVKRKEKALRGNWSAAGIHENTRPF